VDFETTPNQLENCQRAKTLIQAIRDSRTERTDPKSWGNAWWSKPLSWETWEGAGKFCKLVPPFMQAILLKQYLKSAAVRWSLRLCCRAWRLWVAVVSDLRRREQEACLAMEMMLVQQHRWSTVLFRTAPNHLLMDVAEIGFVVFCEFVLALWSLRK
jgi:hypothetical protein